MLEVLSSKCFFLTGNYEPCARNHNAPLQFQTQAGMNESHLSLHVPQGLDFYRLIDLLFFSKIKGYEIYTIFKDHCGHFLTEKSSRVKPKKKQHTFGAPPKPSHLAIGALALLRCLGKGFRRSAAERNNDMDIFLSNQRSQINI